MKRERKRGVKIDRNREKGEKMEVEEKEKKNLALPTRIEGPTRCGRNPRYRGFACQLHHRGREPQGWFGW